MEHFMALRFMACNAMPTQEIMGISFILMVSELIVFH
jgi:hypothetical protein